MFTIRDHNLNKLAKRVLSWLGNIHVLRNQDLGFSDPPPPPFVITFSTERNQKLPFSDPPL